MNHLILNSIRVFVLLATFLTGASLSSRATHLVGGEVFYEHLGNDEYLITLNVYRDCGATNTNQTGFDQFASVGIFIGNVLFENLELDLFDATVNFVPVVLENPCFVLPPDVCVEEAVYQGEVTLPFGPNYDIIYERCCRNPSITNLISPEDTGATFIATVPGSGLVVEQENNNSAYFLNFPPVALCANAAFFFDHAAFDSDGDSLVYEFCTPYTGADPDNPAPNPPNGPPYNPVIWGMGFNANAPISANPAFEIDPISGYITGTPSQVGQYVIGVCVHEFRNGIEINSINRDFQFNVTICDPNIVASIPTQNQFCDGLTFDFDNTSDNAESFFWDFGDLSTTADTSTAPSPTYTYPDTGVYVVTLIANPGWSCADTTSTTYQAYPLIAPAILQNNFSCNGNDIFYDFNAVGEFDNDAEFFWEFEGADIATAETQSVDNVFFNNAQNFTVSLTVFDNGCSVSVEDTFEVPPAPVAIVEEQSLLCQGLSIEFENNSQNAEQFLWNFGDPGAIDDISNGTSPEYTYPDSGSYVVTLIASAPFTCPDTAQATFDIFYLLNPFFTSPGSQCFEGNSFDFLAEGFEDQNTQFSWDFGEFASPSTSNNLAPQNVTWSETGIHEVNLSMNVTGCEASFTSIIEVVPNPLISFDLFRSEGCPPLTVNFLDSSYAETPITYLWNFGDGSTSTFVNPQHRYEEPGYYDVTLDISTSSGCASDLSMTLEDAVFVYPVPIPGFEIEPNTVNILDPKIEVITTATGASEVYYLFGDGGTSQEWEFTYLMSESGLIPVVQTVVNDFGCSAIAEGEVAVEGFVLYVPNAFTPNGDGINDVFLPSTTGVSAYYIEIYNRWGEQIWESTDPNEPWLGEGPKDTHFVENEVYQYHIIVKDLLLYPHEFFGQITLLR